MKRFSLLVGIVLVITLSSMAKAGEVTYELQFTEAKKDFDIIHRDVLIKLNEGAVYDLGENRPGISDCGIDPNSVGVSILPGTPDLIYVQWNDCSHGMGGYRCAFYIVARKENPDEILLSGEVMLHGSWGSAGGNRGDYEYSINYEDSVLGLVVEGSVQDSCAPGSKPHCRMNSEHPYDDIWLDRYETRTTEFFYVGHTSLRRISTCLEYRVQEGDELPQIYHEFQVDPSWLLNPEVIDRPGEWLRIEYPPQKAEELYPKVRKNLSH